MKANGCRREPPSPGGCPPRRMSDRSLTTYLDVVKDYLSNYVENSDQEWQYYATLPSLRDAVEWAALAKATNGKRHSHQCRLRLKTLRLAKQRLRKANFKNCRSFDAV